MNNKTHCGFIAAETVCSITVSSRRLCSWFKKKKNHLLSTWRDTQPRWVLSTATYINVLMNRDPSEVWKLSLASTCSAKEEWDGGSAVFSYSLSARGGTRRTFQAGGQLRKHNTGRGSSGGGGSANEREIWFGEARAAWMDAWIPHLEVILI